MPQPLPATLFLRLLTAKCLSRCVTIRILISYCLYLLLIWAPKAVQAQGTTPLRSLHDYESLPPSPTVAALGSYGNIPVSYHTGVPEISIPLYTLAVKGLEIPVALSYHSNGLLVDERASNVGLGWSCTGLSVIGHTVLGGLSDFDAGGYAAGAEWREVANGLTTSNQDPKGSLYDFSQEILAKRTDVEPDIFSYSFPGHSGKFVFDRQAVAHTIPYECLQIMHQVSGNNSEIGGLTITDESGNRFYFSAGESTVISDLTPGCGSIDGRKNLSGGTAFFLDKIITPYRDTISFTYQPVSEQYLNSQDLTEYEFKSVRVALQGDQNPSAEEYDELLRYAGSCDGIFPRHDCLTQTDHETRVLTSIRHRGETIDFTYDSGRRDLAGGLILSGIVVRYAGEVRKAFRLYHSYFEASGSTPLTGPLADLDNHRLRLDSVQQVGQPAYRFTYNLPRAIGFPPIHAYMQDRWGYYNNRYNNRTLVQRANNLGANRDSDSLAAQVGLLQQIKYPTGGTASFEYEANTLYQSGQILDELEDISGIFLEAPDENSVHEETIFTIVTDSVRTVYATFRFPSNSTTVTGGRASAVLSNAVTGQVYYSVYPGTQDNTTSPITLKLPAGTYRIDAEAVGGHNGDPNTPANTAFSVQLLLRAHRILPGGNLAVGGCRIRQVDVDGQSAYGVAGRTRYVYTDSVGHVSSYALSLPILTSPQELQHTKTLQVRDNTYTVDVVCSYDVHMQASANQVGLIAGSSVGYTRITKLMGPVGGELTHKSVYFYNQFADIKLTSDSYPFPPPYFSFDWFRGKLVREQEYRLTGGGFSLAREKRYTYFVNYNQLPGQPYRDTPYPNQTIIPAYRVLTTRSGQTSNQLVGTQEFKENKFFRYHYISASVFLTKTSEIVYDAQQQPLTTVKLFDYSHDNLLVTRERTRTSSGDTLAKHTFYYTSSSLIPPGTSNPHLLALQQQQRQHILNQPTETVRFLYRAGQAPLALQRSLTLYQIAQGMVMPLRQYASQGGPQVRSLLSFVDFANDSLVYDATYYPLVAHQRYDEFSNIQQQSLPSGRPVVYQYGYRQKLLTAHAVNARWTQLASTSFEEEATGRWHYDSTGTHRVTTASRTGHWAYLLDGTASVSRGQLPAGDYELGCWVQGAFPPTLQLTGGTTLGLQLVATSPGNWHQYKGRVHFTSTGQVSLDIGSGGSPLLLDELRLHPVGAQLTSYTYDPLVGETSQTDPTGRTLTYEYDNLLRLIRTRDEQGRILAQQQYHYAGTK